MSGHTRFTATLAFQVCFDVDHAACKAVDVDPQKVRSALLAQFSGLPSRISGDGMLTYDLPAEVVSWDSQVAVTNG